MKIGLTLQQGHWKAVARKVAIEILAPRVVEIDRDGLFVRANLDALGEHRLMALCVPKEYGGEGADLLTSVIVAEEIAQRCASTAMCYVMHSSAVLPVLAAGTERQIDQYVAPSAQGKVLFSVAGSEPGSGSHVWHVESYCEQVGDRYSINAFKSFATSAGESDYYLVPVRSGKAAAPDDLNLLVVSGRDPQVKPIGRWDGLGLRGNSSTPVHFDHCLVPTAQRIGRAGAGNPILMAFNMPLYMLALSGLYLGVAQRARDVAVAHIQKRIHTDSGKALSESGVAQQCVAEMDCDLDASRSYLYEASSIMSHLNEVLMELARASLLDEILHRYYEADVMLVIAKSKLMVTETAIRVLNKAFQLCGGAGYRKGHEIERLYRDARAGTLMAPDNDTLRGLIGRRACGLPYPWDVPVRETAGV